MLYTEGEKIIEEGELGMFLVNPDDSQVLRAGKLGSLMVNHFDSLTRAFLFTSYKDILVTGLMSISILKAALMAPEWARAIVDEFEHAEAEAEAVDPSALTIADWAEVIILLQPIVIHHEEEQNAMLLHGES